MKTSDPTLFSAVVDCKSKASDWVYNPIEGCMQQQTYTAKLHSTNGQWSDFLGCQHTISAQEQWCSAQHLYWIDSTCKCARDLTPDQCTTLNLFPYQNSCFSTSACNPANCRPLFALSTTRCWHGTLQLKHVKSRAVSRLRKSACSL